MNVVSLAIAFAAAFCITAAVTPLVAEMARRCELVAHPTKDRWHKRPTALMGGVAIFIGFVIAGVVSLLLQRPSQLEWHNLTGILTSAALMFFIGVADDVFRFRPSTKLVLQIAAAAALVSGGNVLALTGSQTADVVITLFWFLVIANALNLLDNMDGVAVGVGALAALFLAVTFAQQGSLVPATLCIVLAGAASGFLPYNFHRATVFMGDSGSLFMGALLAGLASFSGSVTGSVVSVLFVPALIVIIPIADTTLVALTRTLAGRSVTTGGRDHTAHRLVALGLSERQTALVLYGFAAAGGALSLLLQRAPSGYPLWLGAVFLVLLFTAAAYLSRFHTYPAQQAAEAPRITVIVSNLLYRGRALEVVVDLVLFALGYYGALLLRWDGDPPLTQVAALQQTVAVFIAMHLLAFLAMGVYQGVWQRAGLADCIRVLKGVGAGGILSAALFVFVFREAEFSRSVLLIAEILLVVLAIGLRLSFRLLEFYRQEMYQGAPPVVLYGAGTGGELFIRELQMAPLKSVEPVAFADDDPFKRGRLIQGVRVIGSAQSIRALAQRRPLAAIVITIADLPAERLEALHELSRELRVQLFRFRTSLEVVSSPRPVVRAVDRSGA